jgi:ABC-type molybdate transport system substrate-binding protein
VASGFKILWIIWIVIILGLFPKMALAAPDECEIVGDGKVALNVAIDSSLKDPMIKVDYGLARKFVLSRPGRAIKVCHNSTGALASQITSGGNPANYGLFLAANKEGAERVCAYSSSVCLASKDSLPENPFEFVKGITILWTPVWGLIDVAAGLFTLEALEKAVIADPNVSPFGQSARQIMREVTKQWDLAREKLEIVDNMDLAFKLIEDESQKAAGYVSRSQICQKAQKNPGPLRPFYYKESGYEPMIHYGAAIRVDSVDLPDSDEMALDFSNFLKSPAGQKILIDDFCYESVTD